MHPILRILSLSFLLGLACANDRAANFYVATDGLDSNPGTLTKPFASLAKARDAIRRMESREGHIKVFIRQGVYRLTEPLRFGPEDSAPAGGRITYSSFGKEVVQLCGGRPISGWQKEKNNIWTAKLADVQSGQWWFRDLYRDGERLPRSRFPNDSMLTIRSADPEAILIGFKETLPAISATTAELIVLQNWSISRALIAAADRHSLSTATPCGWVGHEWTTAQPGKRAFLEHDLTFVDQPGEWYLERHTGILYYQAADQENPNEHSFIAPVIDQLLVLAGTRKTPIANLHFKGLQFEHANWALPQVGYAGIQACFFGPRYEQEPTYGLPLAIQLEHAENCSFVRCKLQHTGASGLGLAAGCRKVSIIGCEFFDIGGNGVMVGWRGSEQRSPRKWFENDWPDPVDAPVHNHIGNCHVHRCGAHLFGAVGIFAAFSQQTVIDHNLVHDLPYTGISIGFRWDTTATSMRGCRVESNHIHDVMKLLADGGGIYTLGFQPGTVLAANLIHDVHRSPYTHGGAPNNGIFFDQGSKGYTIERNIIYHTAEEPIRFNENIKEWHTWKDNAFGIKPADPGFPRQAAERAGIEAEYRDILPLAERQAN